MSFLTDIVLLAYSGEGLHKLAIRHAKRQIDIALYALVGATLEDIAAGAAAIAGAMTLR